MAGAAVPQPVTRSGGYEPMWVSTFPQLGVQTTPSLLMTWAAPGPDNLWVPTDWDAPTIHHPDPLEATAPAIEVTGDIDLHRLRRQVRELLAGSGAPPQRMHNFVFAVSEIVTNALAYGRPPVQVRVWSAPGRSVCTVTDHGDGFAEPPDGCPSSTPGQSGKDSRGLWMARQMCDVVSAVKTPDAFTLRIINRY